MSGAGVVVVVGKPCCSTLDVMAHLVSMSGILLALANVSGTLANWVRAASLGKQA